MAKPAPFPFDLTDKERLILDAVKPWRKVDSATGRTANIGIMGHGLPPKAHAAIRRTCPMPTTYAGAVAELDEWEALIRVRKVERRALALDPAVWVRFNDVERTLLADLPARTMEEVTDRARRIEFGFSDTFLEKRYLAALVRDLDALSAAQLKASVKQSEPPAEAPLDAALKAEPGLSDREIARRVGLSAPTVAKARRRLGLVAEVRSVKRGSQTFTMRRRGTAAE